MKAPLGLLMPLRSHASTAAGARCGSLRRENRAREHPGGLTARYTNDD
ncbi:hypothetical protein [Roseiflexus sp.]|nr:hypothetical protein [Roseiflexus sp.]